MPAPLDLPAALDGLAPDLDDAAILEATAAEDLDAIDPAAQGVEDVEAPADRRTESANDVTGTHPRVARPAIATPAPTPRTRPSPAIADGARMNGDVGAGFDGPDHGATGPQLRRFIKSRAYVPMHELRRRFAINGGEDDVTPIELDHEHVYVGLPPREGVLLGELLRAGDIGYELSLDPIAPIVVGVYPIRPVPRS